MSKKKKHGGKRPGAGRKRRFKETMESRTLNLPPAFWTILDDLEGSLSVAFMAALRDDDLLHLLRTALWSCNEPTVEVVES